MQRMLGLYNESSAHSAVGLIIPNDSHPAVTPAQKSLARFLHLGSPSHFAFREQSSTPAIFLYYYSHRSE